MDVFLFFAYISHRTGANALINRNTIGVFLYSHTSLTKNVKNETFILCPIVKVYVISVVLCVLYIILSKIYGGIFCSNSFMLIILIAAGRSCGEELVDGLAVFKNQ